MLIPILIQDQTQSQILTSSSNITLYSFFRNGVLGLDLFNNTFYFKLHEFLLQGV